MRELIERLSTPLALRRCVLPTRIIRSATYEGMADARGLPLPALADCYGALVNDAPGTLITGFCAVSRAGRAMHPRQAGIWDDACIKPWQAVVQAVRRRSPETRLFMQLAHTGRQTLRRITGEPVKGAGPRRCTYFRQKTAAMAEADIRDAVAGFAAAARRARQAGFDGVQIHAAHGYLVHQFLSPHTNTRRDRYGEPGLFLRETVAGVRESCGPDFPILLKASWADDRGLLPARLVPCLQAVAPELDAVEVSYGTMEYALNIIRGDCPLDALLRVNPLFSGIPGPLKALWKRFVYPRKRAEFKPFSPNYNLEGAALIRDALPVPVIPVGGIHNLEDMRACLDRGFPAVALCRPFIAEPDLVSRLLRGEWRRSRCTTCNLCTIHCDSREPLRCHRKSK